MNYQEIRAGIETEPSARWLHRAVKLFRFLFGLLLVTGIIVYFRPSDKAQQELKRKIAALKSERDALQTARDSQVRRYEWIKNDVQFLEIAARDRLGLQKDGEFVIRFKAKDSPDKN